MSLLESFWYIYGLNETCANTIGNGSYQFFLGWFLVVIDGKNILSVRFFLEYSFDHSSKIRNMNCWEKIVTITNIWKSERILKPCFFDVLVEYSFTLSVENTSRNDICFNVTSFILEIQDLILYLFDNLVFWDG